MKALSRKQPEGMIVMGWKDSKTRVVSTIRMCLADVMNEESWRQSG